MSRFGISIRTRRWWSALLLVLLFRTYVPVGFMPSGGNPLVLEVCPVGLEVPMSAHMHAMHHHSGAHADFQNCPFGCAPAAGPLSQPAGFEPVGSMPTTVIVSVAAEPAHQRLVRAHPPRGPPSPA